jgi:hypothetical protein
VAELTAADVETFTGGRLTDDGGTGEVSRMLTAALAAARRSVGWHVSPVRRDTLTLDGPRDRILTLPTLHLVELISVTENGIELDLDKLSWSAGRPPGFSGSVNIRKRNRLGWSRDYQSITVTMEHGFTEQAAADWREAILSLVDQMSMLPIPVGAGRSDADLTRKVVDDVEYAWTADYRRLAIDTIYSVRSVLDGYNLDGTYFR